MAAVTVSPKCQVAIPKEIRKGRGFLKGMAGVEYRKQRSGGGSS